MTKKKLDKPFSSHTFSPVIAEFQKLVSMKGGHFPWTQMLEQKEVRFIYDMLAWAEARSDFMPTSAQGRWAAQILIKIQGASTQWQQADGTKSKMPSARADLVARRKAKEYLKRSGVIFAKTTPSDVELVMMLNSIGATDQTPTRAKAKEQLIFWSTNFRPSHNKSQPSDA